MYTCGMTHVYLWHGWSVYVVWLIRGVTHSDAWHDHSWVCQVFRRDEPHPRCSVLVCDVTYYRASERQRIRESPNVYVGRLESYLNVYICVYIHAHTHTHTHTRIHIHTHTAIYMRRCNSKANGNSVTHYIYAIRTHIYVYIYMYIWIYHTHHIPHTLMYIFSHTPHTTHHTPHTHTDMRRCSSETSGQVDTCMPSMHRCVYAYTYIYTYVYINIYTYVYIFILHI